MTILCNFIKLESTKDNVLNIFIFSPQTNYLFVITQSIAVQYYQELYRTYMYIHTSIIQFTYPFSKCSTKSNNYQNVKYRTPIR